MSAPATAANATARGYRVFAKAGLRRRTNRVPGQLDRSAVARRTGPAQLADRRRPGASALGGPAWLAGQRLHRDLWLHRTACARWRTQCPTTTPRQALAGWSPNAAFGWQRNHFDRLIHLLFGVCFTPALLLAACLAGAAPGPAFSLAVTVMCAAWSTSGSSGPSRLPCRPTPPGLQRAAGVGRSCRHAAGDLGQSADLAVDPPGARQ